MDGLWMDYVVDVIMVYFVDVVVWCLVYGLVVMYGYIAMWTYGLCGCVVFGLVIYGLVVVVCSVCSPAGDKIPGDGVSRTHTLKDLRIPLPALGLAPQRVCLHCYLDT